MILHSAYGSTGDDLDLCLISCTNVDVLHYNAYKITTYEPILVQMGIAIFSLVERIDRLGFLTCDNPHQ